METATKASTGVYKTQESISEGGRKKQENGQSTFFLRAWSSNRKQHDQALQRRDDVY